MDKKFKYKKFTLNSKQGMKEKLEYKKPETFRAFQECDKTYNFP